MDQDQKIHELIDSYLHDELVGPPLDLMKRRLREEPEFKVQVEMQLAIIEEIKNQRKLHLKALLAEKKIKRRILAIPSHRTLSIAASILFMVALTLSVRFYISNMNLTSQSEEKTRDSQQIEKEQIQNDLANANNQAKEEAPVNPAESVEKEEVNSPELAVVEDASEDEDVARLEELREAEDKLKSEGDAPKYDELLSFKTLQVKNLAPPPLVSKEEGELDKTRSTTVVPATTNAGNVESKKDEGAGVKAVTEDAETDDYVGNEEVKVAKRFVKIEYWNSIVGFDGYRYDGSKLLLYNTRSDAQVSIVELDGLTYLVRSGKVYKLASSSTYIRYEQSIVTDAKLIKKIKP
ncbi:MAG: hypothetical protein ACI8ZN_000860 [Bacteroidia bacterium]